MRRDPALGIRPQASAWLLLAGWIGLWLPMIAAAQPGDATAQGFVVTHAAARPQDDVYLLDADVDFRLSAAALEALNNGIPLGLVIEIRVERRRNWMWNDAVAALSQRYTLQYHALSDRYVAHNRNTGQRQSYPSLDEALFMLGRIRDFPMLDRRLLEPGDEYLAGVRAALLVEELPTPMRLWAYVSDQWRLDSTWYSWPLHR